MHLLIVSAKAPMVYQPQRVTTWFLEGEFIHKTLDIQKDPVCGGYFQIIQVKQVIHEIKIYII